MDENRVLIVDDDAVVATRLLAMFAEAGVVADVVRDTFSAIEKLRETRYAAVVLDPMIRQRLNGYVVLNFLELEQPETLMRLFLLTGMSEETIRRTAPSAASRLFRKPSAVSRAAAAVIEVCHRGQPFAARPRGRGSVLLVEDDDATALATARLLEQIGYTVERARNGEEACDVLSSREFDAVMLDLVMPKADGFTVIDHFHDARPALLRRMIVTTGMPERYVEALDRTAIGGLLRKPLDPAELDALLRRVATAWIPVEPGGEFPQFQ